MCCCSIYPKKNSRGTVMIRRMVCLLLALLLSMPLLLAGAEEIVQADTLVYGDESDAVKELQTRLKALCYYRGPLSGEFGSLTRDAVKAVQEAYGLPVTGKADPDTLSVIYGECYRPLQYNDQGEDVERLQERLGELGYYTGKVSGKYLNGTKEGIMTFQGEFGLPETGKADVETLHILFSAIVRPTASPSPMPSPTPTLGPRQPFSKTLKYGSTGDDVQKVQQRLMDLGFFTFYKTTQGYYRQTQEAVQAFQEYNGLFVTGQVDESTWNALFNDETVVPQSGEPKPTPEPVPVPYRIEVDVNNQITKIWQYDPETRDYTIHLKSFLCSTGTKSNPSGVGTDTLTDRRSRWCFFSKWGGSKAQYWVKIDEEIAFHSLIYADYDEMTLKTSSYDALGKRASHGCIRLTVADAKWIYDNCPIGTKVVINDSRRMVKPTRKKLKISGSRRTGWDPTDPNRSNPYRPKVKVKASYRKGIPVGTPLDVKSAISLKSKFSSQQELLDHTVIKGKVDTSKAGTYRVKIKVQDPNTLLTAKKTCSFIVR